MERRRSREATPRSQRFSQRPPQQTSSMALFSFSTTHLTYRRWNDAYHVHCHGQRREHGDRPVSAHRGHRSRHPTGPGHDATQGRHEAQSQARRPVRPVDAGAAEGRLPSRHDRPLPWPGPSAVYRRLQRAGQATQGREPYEWGRVPLRRRRLRRVGQFLARRRHESRPEPAAPLFAPAEAAAVTKPPRLRWQAVAGATYYNMQLDRAPPRRASALGTKILQHLANSTADRAGANVEVQRPYAAPHTGHVSLVCLARLGPEVGEPLRPRARTEHVRRQA